MSLIIINDEMKTAGDVEFFQRIVVNEDNTKSIVYEGVLTCDRYFEEIDKIETRTLLIEGVYVFQEKFSTVTDDIQYAFTATSFNYTREENENE